MSSISGADHFKDHEYTRELRERLALHAEQRANLARARAMQAELRGRELELRQNSAAWAIGELAEVRGRLARLDEITRDSWHELTRAGARDLQAWLDG